MINPPQATKAPTIERKAILDWSLGTVTDYDARRVLNNALASSSNMILEQNGVIRPRPALTLYGPQPVGEILGEIFECKVVNGTTPKFYMIAMMAKDGVANLYYTMGESASWTKIEGKTYDTKAPARFLQVSGKVLVLNGEALSYIDTEAWRVVSFNTLQNPRNAPTCTLTNLSGTDFKIYYAITANSAVGETAASPILTQSISTPRDLWSNDKDVPQKITLSWEAVAGATGYNVYAGVSADGAGKPTLYMIASSIDSTVTKFTDNGTAALNLGPELPSYNSTDGPKTKRGAVVNGRIWLVGDTKDPYYVRFGGDPGHELDFSPAHGGGFVMVASGTKEVPIAVMPFRRGTGDSTVVVLTQGSNGSGKRYHLVSNTITYGTELIPTWDVVEDSGADGTDSPDGVVIYNNSLFYPSRDGFKTTGTLPQLQNVLSTRTISETIRNQISLLNSAEMSKAVGLVYEGRIYWALPVGSTENNRVWIYHPDQKGAWMTSWYLKVKWMTLYNDNGGDTHFLMYCDDGKIYELNRHVATADNSVAFRTDLTSGQIQFAKDGRDWARLIQVVFTFLRPKGKIGITIEAMTEDGEMRYGQTLSMVRKTTAEGWSKVTNRSPRLVGWSRPSAQNERLRESVDAIVEIDEDVQWFTYAITTSTAGTDYKLSSVVAEYVPIGIKDLS